MSLLLTEPITVTSTYSDAIAVVAPLLMTIHQLIQVDHLGGSKKFPLLHEAIGLIEADEF